MKQRVTSGIIGAIILILVLLSDRIFLTIGVSLLSFLAIVEVYSIVGFAKRPLIMLMGFVASVGFFVALAFVPAILPLLLYLFIILLFCISMNRRNPFQLQEIALLFFLTSYLIFCFYNIVLIRKMPQGGALVWLVFVCAFMTDTFALLGGKFFGKHKLAPVLSPHKTIEGSIGGVLGCVLSVVVYCLVLQYAFHYTPNYGSGIVFALVGSGLAQLGDLAASSIKRQYNVKNYGNIMPGHGGVMDRFDSVLFVAPFAYYYLSVFPLI